MNYIDIIVLVILGISLYKGTKNGLLIEVFSLLSLVLGVYCTIHYSQAFQTFLQEHIEINDKYAYIISLASLFCLTVFAVSLIGKMLTKVLESIALGSINKILGAVFSILKSFIIISIVFAIILFVNDSLSFIDKVELEKSSFYNLHSDVSVYVKSVFDSYYSGQG
ncbi:MAG: CvpA family protein [Flavobacteriaceae bacterium]|nr:CvpA family protein [Flavobacteriaceae bacterium]